MEDPLPIDAFTSDVVTVARRLLGCTVRSTIGERAVSVRLDEVEAYGAGDDPASHAHRGETPRNRSMFGAAGLLYVYRSYGIHWCMNVVVGPAGEAGAVLLRGGEVVEGRDVAADRRGRRDHLADGPGKLCQALGVTGAHDGLPIGAGPITIVDRASEPSIASTPRIGITRAVDREWRFVAGDGPTG